MTAPQHNIAPASPVSAHLPVVTGAASVVFGIVALVLLLCVITLDDMPAAPMNFAAITAALLGAIAWTTKMAQQIVKHQQACFEAGRRASEADVANALRKVHKDVDKLRTAMVARTSAEVFGPPAAQVHRLDIIDGGRNGMG